MKIKDLIKELQKLDQEKEIYILNSEWGDFVEPQIEKDEKENCFYIPD